MNPFMFTMMNTMGMGFMPFSCGCGVNMPYYGSNDMLTFMNFPIFRNTSNDYLLDPRLAMMQAQQQWQQGGNIFSNSYLPLFNNFPGMNNPISSWWNNPWQKTPESEEEKKKREEKEAESKKPEAVKATSLKKVFDGIKKLAETNKGYLTLTDDLIKQADEAMKKETATEQLSEMKKVFSAIPEEVIRKSILANDEVKKQLIEAGYNFNYKNNTYSLPVTPIVDNMNDVHDSIVSKLSASSNNTGLPLLAANVTSGKTPILAAISTWNNTQKEKGIINFIANNVPTEIGAVTQMKECVKQIVNALIGKADEYSGCNKIKKERDNLASLKDKALANFNAANLKNLSAAFEILYARLRMQEAVKVRDSIKNNTDYKTLNEVKPGVIPDDMIVKETYESLKAEGISSTPTERDLDKIATATVVTVGTEGVIDADKKYENNPQGLLDEYLKGVLTKDGDVYKTKDFDGKGSGVKYYTISDGKVVEAKKKADGTFEVGAAVSSNTILEYDETLNTIKSMRDSKSIEQCKDEDFVSAKLPYPVFKAATKNEYYALIGNTFGKIKGCTGLAEDKTNKKVHATGTKKTLDKLTEADLESFDSSSVKSKAQEAKEKKEAAERKEQESIQCVTNFTFASLKEAKSNKKLDEISKAITGKDGKYDFEALDVNGYFYSKSTKRYYRYNEETNQLEYLKDVVKIYDNGYMEYRKVDLNKKKTYIIKQECTEVISDTPINKDKDEELILAINEYGQKFGKDVNGGSGADEDIDMCRKLNTIIAKKDPIYTTNFIKGYQDYNGFWSDKGICRQIATENGLAEGTNEHVLNSKRRYIREIARLMIQVVGETSFSRSERNKDWNNLVDIANGKLLTDPCCYDAGFGLNQKSNYDNIKYTAIILDNIIEKVMKAYDEKPKTT